ncbi:unnamed protein product [Paramecium sonneborni]|uniref:Uncharacterized protein n=1 Tax=Paramecium sonneborni TaxID=65129 RepID=A0A8S1NXJ1_9CILI|nr:unnamed protein product [Paramecium sonneborni]
MKKPKPKRNYKKKQKEIKKIGKTNKKNQTYNQLQEIKIEKIEYSKYPRESKTQRKKIFVYFFVDILKTLNLQILNQIQNKMMSQLTLIIQSYQEFLWKYNKGSCQQKFNQIVSNLKNYI